MAKPKSSSGSFVFSRPGKFRWTYSKPYEQILSAMAKTLTMYDKDLKQVTKRSLGSAIGSSPAAVLFGSGDLSQNFTLTDAGERDGRSWVHAKPKGQSKLLQRKYRYEKRRAGCSGAVRQLGADHDFVLLRLYQKPGHFCGHLCLHATSCGDACRTVRLLAQKCSPRI